MIMISVLLDISKWQKLTIFSQKKNAERKMFTLRGGNDKTKKNAAWFLVHISIFLMDTSLWDTFALQYDLLRWAESKLVV